MLRRRRLRVLCLRIVLVAVLLCLFAIAVTLISRRGKGDGEQTAEAQEQTAGIGTDAEDAEQSAGTDVEGAEQAAGTDVEDAEQTAGIGADVEEAEQAAGTGTDEQADVAGEDDVQTAGQDEAQAEETDATGTYSQEDLVVLTDPDLYTYEGLAADAAVLAALYPNDVTVESIAETLDGRSLYHLVIGDPDAETQIFINAGIHAREYITCQLVMKQCTVFLAHLAAQDAYGGQTYRELLTGVCVHLVPMVNPDGVTISQLGLEGLKTESARARVQEIAALDGQTAAGDYLTRWKANANGVDLNRNFDALWESYEGASHASADHYKGNAVGCEPESAALIRLTQETGFDRTVSYHTQGGVIYWYFAQTGELYDQTLAFARRIGNLTGYALDANYESLDPAGYKDWAISAQEIPSLTIEVGHDTSPVPSAQLEEIWTRNEHVWEETILDAK